MKRGEMPGQALQRACGRHVQKAVASLKGSAHPEAVHNVRREIKRMRAIFRLTRGSLSLKNYRKTANTMRLAAKTLSAARDACVIKRAFESLAGRRTRQFPKIESALNTNLRRADRNFINNDFGRIAKLILKRASRQIADLDLSRASWTEVRSCLKKSYKLARDAHHEATRKASSDHFHEWRKLVKNLWYQLDFICAGRSPAFQKMQKSLEKLSDRLGVDHDLLLLEHFAQEHRDAGKESTKLRHMIGSQRREYGIEIKRLGASMFTEPPEKLCAKLEKVLKLGGKSRRTVASGDG